MLLPPYSFLAVATLFYIAFFKEYNERCEPNCGYELRIQVAIIFFVNDFLTRLLNSLIVPAEKRWFTALGDKDVLKTTEEGQCA